MASAFAAAATLAAAALVLFGAGERGTDIALKATARLSFLLFWLAYAGGGLAMLAGPGLQSLKRHGREFGLAFASAHLIHIALVVWLCWIGAAPDAGVFRFFLPPLVFVYILALFSIRRLRQALGRIGWWLLRTFAMTYIAYAFATDFWPYPLGGAVHILEYLPFAVLSIAARSSTSPRFCLLFWTAGASASWHICPAGAAVAWIPSEVPAVRHGSQNRNPCNLLSVCRDHHCGIRSTKMSRRYRIVCAVV
jgi:hypothetical protein